MAAVEVIEIKGDASSAIDALKKVGIEAQKTQAKATEANEAISDGLEALDKQTNGAVSAFKSLQGGVKSAVSAFTTLKGAIIATGLGALLVAVTSLVAYFKETERGGDALAIVLGALGAAVGKVTDLIIKLGENLFKAFQNPAEALRNFGRLLRDNITNRIEGLLELLPALGKAIGLALKGEFSDAAKVAADAAGKVTLGVENVTDKVGKAVDQVKAFGQSLVDAGKEGARIASLLNDVEDAERALIAQRAIANKQIAEARLIADDITKSTKERIAAVERAGAIEEKVARQELSVQKQRLAALQAQANLNEKNEDFLIQIEQARARVFELEQANIQRRRRLQTETISLLNEELNKVKEIEKARQDAEKLRFEKSEKNFNDYVDKSVAAANKGAGQVARVGQFYTEAIENGATSSAATLGDYINFTIANLDAVSQAISGFAQLAGENTQMGKALAVAQIIIDTYMGATKAIATYAPPFGQIAAAGVIAAGLANLNKVKSVQVPTSPDQTPSASIQAPTAASAPPQFNIVGQSNINQLAQSIGGQFQQPIRAYVVGQDVTTSQQLQRQRIRTATFG